MVNFKNIKSITKVLKKKISKILHLRLVQLIRCSLIYNMFIMFLIIMLFLQILFLMSPQNGSVSYSGPVINNAEIECETVNIRSSMKSVSVTLASKDAITINFSQILLIPTSDDPTIYIESTNDQTFYTNILVPAGLYDGTQKNSSSLTADPHVTTCYNYFDTLVNSKTGFMFDVDEGVTLRLTFSRIDAYVKTKTGELKKVESIDTQFFCCTSECTLRLFTGYGDTTSLIQEYNISFLNFNKACFVAKGDFYVSFTSKENRISSTMREIEIESSDGKIHSNMEYKNNNFSISLYGQVNKGAIDGYTIFPTFINWYYDNVFFAPLTLISTITGGIVLMKKKNY